MKIQINKQLILEGFENHISDIDNMTMDNFRKMDPQQQTLENLQSTQLIAGGSKDKILGMGLDNTISELIKYRGGLLKYQKSNNNMHADLAEGLLLSMYGLIKHKNVL